LSLTELLNKNIFKIKMNSKSLLFLVGSLLALPQNYEIIGNSNSVASVESKLTRRAYANEHDNTAEKNVSEYFWSEESEAIIKDILQDEFDLEAGIDYKVTSFKQNPAGDGFSYVELTQLVNGVELKYANIDLKIDSQDKLVSVDDSFEDIDSPNDKEQDWGSPIEAAFSLFDYLDLDREEDSSKVDVIANDSKDTYVITNISDEQVTVVAVREYLLKDGELKKVWSFELKTGKQFVSASISPSGEIVEIASSIKARYLRHLLRSYLY
jgi:Zn-dependent metalloprotease